ncbi:unnamed protein product [Amoebophrya sp. A25]|nr:unnamed protein product [Amoebophrya sp. A25]CAD7977196.1 unnamed protein product [Amoebophrya sp. A25]|eukprot:GSA25T00028036001.1
MEMWTQSKEGFRYMSAGKTEQSSTFAGTWLTAWTLRSDLVVRCFDAKEFQKHLVPKWVDSFNKTMEKLKQDKLGHFKLTTKEETMWNDLAGFSDEEKALLYMKKQA